MPKQLHRCGLTGEVFNSEQEYLDHVSSVTGYKPTDIRHFGARAIQVAKAALSRKGKLTKTREAELDAQIDEVNEAGVDHKIMEARRDRSEAKNLKAVED